MSHYTKMAVEAKQSNEQDLVGALKAHFGEDVEVYDQAKPLKLWNGGAAKGGHYGEAEDCHIIVRRATVEKKRGTHCATNDLGWKRNADGQSYTAFVDAAGFHKGEQDSVMRDYAERVATRRMKSQGYSMKREALKDGRIKLSFSKLA
jgi:hypothetical protein